MREDLLPNQATATDLPLEATETKCQVRSDEIVVLFSDGRAKMPDGTLRQSLTGCKFENGSSFIIYHGDDSNKMTALRNTKPRQKIFPAVTVAPPPTPTSDDNVLPAVEVPTSQITNITSQDAAADPLFAMIIGVAAISAVAVSSLISSVKTIRSKKLNDIQSHNDKRQQEQNKCNSKSDLLEQTILQVHDIADNSIVHNTDIKHSRALSKFTSSLHDEVSKLDKRIDRLQNKLKKGDKK